MDVIGCIGQYLLVSRALQLNTYMTKK